MKFKKFSIFSKARKIPEIRFDEEANQSLTSFSGLVTYQFLFQRLNLEKRLKECFVSQKQDLLYDFHLIALILIIHLSLGYKWLRDISYYKNDPMVLRVLGLKQLPDVSTLSRTLKVVDDDSIDRLKDLSKEIVLQRLENLNLPRITLDFDGSVLSTTRHAQGTAVGFNKKKKGARSYYPLFCTVAQTAQFLDVYHRPGNVHDSNGAIAFSTEMVENIRKILPKALIESRTDSAFFSEDQLDEWNELGVEFTASVPFERFTDLKTKIESRKRWHTIDEVWSFFEENWAPESWGEKYRFIFMRQKSKKQIKGPLQLELFSPRDTQYEYKVIVTNKQTKAEKVLLFHNGRGSQEAIFAEVKTNCNLEYIPVKRLNGNKLYCLSAMLAHNLHKEMQINTYEQDRGITAKRSPLWKFESISTFRKNVLQRAGRLIRPQGKLTLVIGKCEIVKQAIVDIIESPVGYFVPKT